MEKANREVDARESGRYAVEATGWYLGFLGRARSIRLGAEAPALELNPHLRR
jgi:hypothetical protein